MKDADHDLESTGGTSSSSEFTELILREASFDQDPTHEILDEHCSQEEEQAERNDEPNEIDELQEMEERTETDDNVLRGATHITNRRYENIFRQRL